MGHHARTLLAAIAVLAATLLVSDAALAAPALVRVETPGTQSSFQAFVNRTAVDTAGPLPVTDPTTPANFATCGDDSAVAALTAAVGAGNVTYAVAGDETVSVTSIKGLTAPVGGDWTWTAFADSHLVKDLCHGSVPAGTEVLFFPGCPTATTPQASCFTGGALYMRIGTDGLYPTAPYSVPVAKAPVESTIIAAWTDGSIKPTVEASVTTDEGYRTTSNDPHKEGLATLAFTEAGPHIVRALQPGWVPVRAPVCATDGKDGFCGTTRFVPPDFDANNFPSPCTTNGHDGFCGTDDTSGPAAHVTNIRNKQVFKKKKGPGQVKGTLDLDPNGVGDVKLRLTRVVTTKVAIKAKKAKKKAHKSAATAAKAKKKAKVRYRTVKTCTTWNDATALLTTAKCGTKYGKWFVADLSDLRNEFSYSFALTLPHGTYTLEVSATDENGSKDAPAPGRNVLVFTVQ